MFHLKEGMFKTLKQRAKLIIPRHKVSKVSLFIVGAQKAGTSALHNYLTKHEGVKGGTHKELNYFNHLEKYNKGVNWYHSKFTTNFFYQSKSILIDSTPQYLNDIEIARKIYDYNPKAKIVILLREPVSRAFSAWNMYKQFSELNNKKKEKLIQQHIPIKEAEKFRELIDNKPFPSFDSYIGSVLNNEELKKEDYFGIIDIGKYYEKVKAYIDQFGIENIYMNQIISKIISY